MVIVVPDHEVGVTVDVALKIELHDLKSWVNHLGFGVAASLLFN